MAFTTIQKAASPSATLFDTAPVFAPLPGTQLISDLQWNNLYDILDGVSTDKINAAGIGSGLVSNTEFDYLNLVTSPIQAQIDSKSTIGHGHVAADISDFNNAVRTNRLDQMALAAAILNINGQDLDNVNSLISNAANPASAGAIRLGNNEKLAWRNFANTADIEIKFTDNDALVFTSQFYEQVFADAIEYTWHRDLYSAVEFAIGSLFFTSLDDLAAIRSFSAIQTSTIDSGNASLSAKMDFYLASGGIEATGGNPFISLNGDLNYLDIFGNDVVNVGNLNTHTIPGGTDVFAMLAAIQTITNKNINATNNTITDTAAALGDLLKYDGTRFKRFEIGTANQLLAVNAGGTDLEFVNPGAISQTPWGADIDAAGFFLDNFNFLRSNAATPAGTGTIRLGGTELLAWRNQGNSANLSIGVNASDQIELNTGLNVGGNITLTTFGITSAEKLTSNKFAILQYQDFTEVATPAAPGAALARVYAKDVSGRSHLFLRDDVGEVDIHLIQDSPWLANHDAAQFNLINVGYLNVKKDNTTGLAEIEANHTTPVTQDVGYLDYIDDNDTGVRTIYGRVKSKIAFPNSFNESGELYLSVMQSGTLSDVIKINRLGNNEIEVTYLLRMGGRDIADIGNLISNAANPANSGFVRIGNNSSIGWRNSANSNNHFIRFNSSNQFAILIDNSSEYTFSATEADWLGNNLRNVGFLESDAANPATASFGRLGNNELLAWRNAANSQNHSFGLNASDKFEMLFNAVSEYTFSTTALDMNSNDLINTGITANRRIQGFKGSDVASASTITLGDGNFFVITGTTNISFMTTTNWQAGSIVTLKFSAALTLFNDAASPPGGTASFHVNGGDNVVATDDTFTFLYDGSKWREIARGLV